VPPPAAHPFHRRHRNRRPKKPAAGAAAAAPQTRSRYQVLDDFAGRVDAAGGDDAGGGGGTDRSPAAAAAAALGRLKAAAPGLVHGPLRARIIAPGRGTQVCPDSLCRPAHGRAAHGDRVRARVAPRAEARARAMGFSCFNSD
jgi:hypothetical protein